MIQKSVKFLGATLVAFLPVVASAQWQNGTDIYNTNSGNVGIGLTNPTTKLHVFGEITMSGAGADFRWAPRSGSGITMLAYNPSGTDLRIFSTLDVATFTADGRLGIGTTSPETALHVAGEITMGGASADMRWQPRSGTGNTMIAYNPNGTDLRFFSSSDVLTITATGRVGVNTSTPAYALDVNGVIHATQVIGATYQDVAEWVPASEPMGPGTVVVLQRDASNQVMPSATAYDTAVAGVVSPQPGIILGEPSPSKAQIATTGRVKVRVDARKHPVHVGDLLVSSDTPGEAMVSVPVELSGIQVHRPGTILGKALEPLASGEGEILVLLSLQ
jgi:hypothetical protein